jgi:hypothetical protein
MHGSPFTWQLVTSCFHFCEIVEPIVGLVRIGAITACGLRSVREYKGHQPGRMTEVGSFATFRAGTAERRMRNVDFRRVTGERATRIVAKRHQQPCETVACISRLTERWPTSGFDVFCAFLRRFVSILQHGPSTFDIPCSIFGGSRMA